MKYITFYAKYIIMAIVTSYRYYNLQIKHTIYNIQLIVTDICTSQFYLVIFFLLILMDR